MSLKLQYEDCPQPHYKKLKRLIHVPAHEHVSQCDFCSNYRMTFFYSTNGSRVRTSLPLCGKKKKKNVTPDSTLISSVPK